MGTASRTAWPRTPATVNTRRNHPQRPAADPLPTEEGQPEEQIRRAVMLVLKDEFLPEFLNRIDEVILFHPLGREELGQIVEIQLRRLQAQLAEAELRLRIDDAAKQRLADEGFDPTYGAGPLKRVIQQRLVNVLATALLERRINPGDIVEIGWEGHQFAFTPAHAEVASA